MSNLPSASAAYDRALLQRVINAVADLQKAAAIPVGKIAMVDISTGENKNVRVNAGVVEAVDP